VFCLQTDNFLAVAHKKEMLQGSHKTNKQTKPDERNGQMNQQYAVSRDKIKTNTV
jgi:hypothetical protein